MTDPRRRPTPAGAGRRPGGSRPRRWPPARGGAVEGLAWLGRPPEAKASLALSAPPAGRAVRHLRRLPVPDPDRRAGAPARAAATCWSRRPTAAGWTRSSSCTPSRPSRGPGSSAAPRRRSPRAGASGSSTGRRPAAGLARRGRGRPARRVGAGGRRQRRASSPRCPRARSAARPGRLGPFRTGWAVIALRTDAPIVPLAMAGTEELYLGRRMASRVLPVTTARALAGLAPDAPLPAAGLARGARRSRAA